MSFGGSVSAMINSIKMNRNAQKKGDKNYFDKDGFKASKSEKLVDPVKLNEADQQKMNASIQNQSRLEKKKELKVLLIALGVGVLFLTYLSWLLFE